MLNKYTEHMIEIKKHIETLIISGEENVDLTLQKYFRQGGKGIRPLLAVVCSNLGHENNWEAVKNIAALTEIIHTTTLIHDDIIDKASERRGNPTLNKLHSNKKALYYGDYLFARVLNKMAQIENLEIHNYLATTLKNLCQGEIIQYRDLYNINTTKRKYLKKIRNKTAILLAFACVSGSLTTNAQEKDVKASYKFGYYLGMSYQIMDDYLDFTAENIKLGKDVGQDLVSGNITLPTILKIEKDTKLFLNFNEKSVAEKKELINLIKNDNEVLEKTLELSNKYLQKALTAIKDIEENVRQDLEYIVKKMYRREY